MKDLTRTAKLLSKLIYYQKLNARSTSIFGGRIEKKFLDFLLSEGLINGYAVKQQKFDIFLGYSKDGHALMSKLVKISPGRKRVFIKTEELKKINPQLGIYILSTTEGFMSNFNAINKNLGGFLLYYIR